jgi:hypothetical protein
VDALRVQKQLGASPRRRHDNASQLRTRRLLCKPVTTSGAKRRRKIIGVCAYYIRVGIQKHLPSARARTSIMTWEHMRRRQNPHRRESDPRYPDVRVCGSLSASSVKCTPWKPTTTYPGVHHWAGVGDRLHRLQPVQGPQHVVLLHACGCLAV